MPVLEMILHTLTIMCLLAAATTLSVIGHDATPAWTALGGYLGFAGVRRVTNGSGK